METPHSRERVDEVTTQNWQHSQRLRSSGPAHFPAYIEEKDGRYRGVFGIDGRFGYDCWFDELDTALRWVNGDGGAVVVTFTRPGRTAAVPYSLEPPWHEPLWWERAGWYFVFAFWAVVLLAYCAFLFVLIPWMLPWLWPLIPICIVAAWIGWRDAL